MEPACPHAVHAGVKTIDGQGNTRFTACAQCGSRLECHRWPETAICTNCLLRSALDQDDYDPGRTARRSDQSTNTPAMMALPIEFGDYELLQVIGRGGQGVVVPCPAKKSQSHRGAEGDRAWVIGPRNRT